MNPQMPIRTGAESDVTVINTVIEAAVMSWPLADRVKRLSLPLLKYDELDVAHMSFLLCESEGAVVGIAAWDGEGQEAQLHGLYVHPMHQHRGAGRLLLNRVKADAVAEGYSSLWVKAERVATHFFDKAGFKLLPQRQESDYPYRYWIGLDSALKLA